MQVILAGYNIDSSIIETAHKSGIPSEKLTPEVLSAAYARISRNPSPVNELRQKALEEVSKARASNEKIIFGMGHHSVAEHAVFNFDIIGISRLAIEALEHFRLCSFTEKSQRYITLDNDYVTPKELENSPFLPKVEALIKNQSQAYNKLFSQLFIILEKKHSDLCSKKAGKIIVEGWAKEDARYATMLCTSGQLGFTANARNLELIIRRLSASPLEEIRSLALALHQKGAQIAPSILLFTRPEERPLQNQKKLKELARQFSFIEDKASAQKTLSLITHTPNPDLLTAAALMSNATGKHFQSCFDAVSNCSHEQLLRIFKESLANMEFYDSPPREFEHVSMTFEATVSAAAFGQLKRHRMMSQSVLEYNPALGLVTPPAIEEANLTPLFTDFCSKALELYYEISETMPEVAPYFLTNAHCRKVIFTVNLRDLYHFCRLREDAHAQWDIRNLAHSLRQKAQKIMPLGSLLLCGKDAFSKQFKSIYGHSPSFDQER